MANNLQYLRLKNADYLLTAIEPHGIGLCLTGAHKGQAIRVRSAVGNAVNVLDVIDGLEITHGDKNKMFSQQDLAPVKIGNAHYWLATIEKVVGDSVKVFYMGVDPSGAPIFVKKITREEYQRESSLLQLPGVADQDLLLSQEFIPDEQTGFWAIAPLADLELQTLNTFKGMGLSVIARYVHQWASALAFLHQHGRIHGDVKYNNAVIHRGKIHLIDCHSSVFFGERLVSGNEFMYCPDESFVLQCATPQLDICALGVNLFGLLLDIIPDFHEKKIKAGNHCSTRSMLTSHEHSLLLMALQAEAQPWQKKMCSALYTLIVKMLAMDYPERPTAMQIKYRLEACLRESPQEGQEELKGVTL